MTDLLRVGDLYIRPEEIVAFEGGVDQRGTSVPGTTILYMKGGHKLAIDIEPAELVVRLGMWEGR